MSNSYRDESHQQVRVDRIHRSESSPSENEPSALVFEETRGAAKTLAIELQSLEVRGPGDFDGVLDSAVRKRVDALVVVDATAHLLTRAAADTLNLRGIRTASGKQWHAMQVLRARQRFGL